MSKSDTQPSIPAFFWERTARPQEVTHQENLNMGNFKHLNKQLMLSLFLAKTPDNPQNTVSTALNIIFSRT